MNIIVNGKTEQVLAVRISYDAVVKLALGDRSHNVLHTVTFRSERAQGTLVPGESVGVAPGMVFNVAYTGNA